MAQLKENQALQALHTFAFTERAAYVGEAQTEAQLVALLRAARARNLKVTPLGEGSNLLFTRRYEGALLRLCSRGVQYRSDSRYHYLHVAGGEPWHGFVCHCLDQGFGGLENLSLIPGTVGAAPVQNIGAYGVSLSDFLVSLEVYTLSTQEKVRLAAADCRFGYRSSLFRAQPDEFLITSLQLRLPRRWQPQLRYEGMRVELERRQISTPTARDVADAVVALRRAKLPDPTQLPNAGSFFKNPSVSAEEFAALRHRHPLLSGRPSNGEIKLSAAQLIETCGWKGQRRGGVGVSETHALVLVHHGGGTGRALWQLAEEIRTSVQARFGIVLQPEVRIL